MAKSISGPAAYHATREANILVALRAENVALRLEVSTRPTAFALAEAERAAAVRGYAVGLADGYRHGACDALEHMSPDHARALACRG